MTRTLRWRRSWRSRHRSARKRHGSYTRDAAITFLVVAILLATCDLFWLNLLYDRARVSGAAVSNRGIIFPLFVVLWPAGVLFVMGFAYLARLTVSFQ